MDELGLRRGVFLAGVLLSPAESSLSELASPLDLAERPKRIVSIANVTAFASLPEELTVRGARSTNAAKADKILTTCSDFVEPELMVIFDGDVSSFKSPEIASFALLVAGP